MKSKWSKTLIIKKLQVKARALGRPPTSLELTADISMPHDSVLRFYFGTTGAAFKAAGLARYRHMPQQKYSDGELIAKLVDYINRSGHTPSYKEAGGWSKFKMPARCTYVLRFGGWSNALRRAGFSGRLIGDALSASDLTIRKHRAIEVFRAFFNKHGRWPLLRDFPSDDLPGLCGGSIQRWFGSWNKAIAAAETTLELVDVYAASERAWKQGMVYC